MGEYWMPCNVTRKERIEPHDLGCGIKLGQWHWEGSRVMNRIDELTKSGRWGEDDQIFIASDYRGLMQIRGPADPKPPDDLYDVAEDSYENVSLDTEGRSDG